LALLPHILHTIQLIQVEALQLQEARLEARLEVRLAVQVEELLGEPAEVLLQAFKPKQHITV